MNTGDIFFASSDLVTMEGNMASESVRRWIRWVESQCLVYKVTAKPMLLALAERTADQPSPLWVVSLVSSVCTVESLTGIRIRSRKPRYPPDGSMSFGRTNDAGYG